MINRNRREEIERKETTKWGLGGQHGNFSCAWKVLFGSCPAIVGKGVLPGSPVLDGFVTRTVVSHQCWRECQPVSQSSPWKRGDQVDWPQTFFYFFFLILITPQRSHCIILNSLQQILPLTFEASSALVHNAGSSDSSGVGSATLFLHLFNFFRLQSLKNPTRQLACPFAPLATRALHT